MKSSVVLAATSASLVAVLGIQALRRYLRRRALLAAWERDGYVIIKGLLSQAECDRLEASVTTDNGILCHAHGRDDGMGRMTKMALWNHPGDDVTGMVARIPRVRGTMEMLLGGECYHYHTKLMMKDARVGGAHLWHQDFGYWCNNGCCFPHMGTCFITIDKMDSENAGLMIMPGSHKLGLIQHHMQGGQAEVDKTKFGWAKEHGLETVQLEMEPGDACFFHCLTAHASGQNHSDRRR